MSDLLDRLAESLLTADELSRWIEVREHLDPGPIIYALDGPATPAERLSGEAQQLYESIVRAAVAAAQDKRLTVYGVPADDPLAEPKKIAAAALTRAIRDDINNLDLIGRHLLRGGLVLMVDLDLVAEVSPRRGRPSLAEADAPLVTEMAAMIAAEPGLSPTQAAWRVVERAAGDGTDESRVRRLIDAHRRKFLT